MPTVLLIIVALEFSFAYKYLKLFKFNSPVCVKPFQLTIMQAAKKRKDVTEDSDEEGNFYG